MNYFTKGGYEFDFYTLKKFRLVKSKLIFCKYFKFFEIIFNKVPRVYEKFFRYILPAEEIYFELSK
jgi:hypothetical protein